MSSPRFEARVQAVVPAALTRVWEAFATGDGFSKVYEGIHVEGDWKVGGQVVWSGVWEGTEFRDEGTITAYDAPRLFEYTYWTSFWGLERSPDSVQTIRNEFRAVPGGTEVTITQTNIRSAESRDQSAKNWRDILDKMNAALR